MVDVVITNADGIGLNNAIGVIGSNKPSQIGASGQTDYAMYSYSDGDGEVPGSSNFTVQGSGFSYDSNGLLAGGTITSITIAYTVQGQYDGGESYSDFEIPVQSVVNFGRLGDGGQSGAMAILAGNDAISSNGFGAFAYGGNDTFTIVGTGSPFPTTGITQINGGSGANTAVFPYALREAATITGGGGTETVVQSGITANLVSIDKIQFIDGSTYEDTTTPGAQAALAFQGILGRQPDAINAGGYGQLAEQNGVATAATALLATPEGQADTASLSNADFVTRLYQNILDRAPDAQGAAGWQADLDSGSLDRGAVVADFASSPEAQQVNAAQFGSGAVFAADPNAVEVLRAYEILLNRLPEAAALSGNTTALDNSSQSLQQLYGTIQASPEFAANVASTGGSNPYGITASTSYGSIHTIAVSNQVTSLITPLVTSNGVAVHS